MTTSISDRYKLHTKPQVSDSSEYEDPHKFQFDFHGEFRKRYGFYCTSADPTKSTVCSPLSAMTHLGKMAYGSDGITQKEIINALSLKKASNIFPYFRDQIARLTYLQGVHLDIASQMYFSHRYEISPEFGQQAANTFQTIGEYSNMEDPENTARQINNWVQSKTHDKVKNIISPNDIKPEFKLILINGVYFSGLWMKAFIATSEAKFFTQSRDVYLPMMTVTNSFNYGISGTLEADIIQIPYSSGQVNFYLLLPHNRFGADMIVNKLRMAPKLLSLVEITEGILNITMPQFKIETTLDMAWLLKKSTITQVFYPKYGLKSLVPEKTYYVDKAIQKTVFEMESGGESAGPLVIQENTVIKQCYANHPFAFVIASGKDIIIVGYFNGEVNNAIIDTKVMKFV